jgi:hypothetical protein
MEPGHQLSGRKLLRAGEEAARDHLERQVPGSIRKPESVQERCRTFAVVRGESLGKGHIQQLKRRGQIDPTKISSGEARTGGTKLIKFSGGVRGIRAKES